MKRFSAFLLDLVLVVIVFTGALFAVSSILDYDSYFTALETRVNEIQESHSIKEVEQNSLIYFDEYQYMTEEEKLNLPLEVQEVYAACTEEIRTDKEYLKLSETIMSLSILMLSISMLAAFILLEFIVPLILKNGQTVGKKIFSIAVMRNDAVKISPVVLFIRAILGKYTIGTMLPIIMLLMLLAGAAPIIPIAIILLVLLLQLVLLITTRTRSLIHDYLSSTVVVDLQSQMIFESAEAKQEYQLRLHKEAAEKANY